jgi:hypothetical protein
VFLSGIPSLSQFNDCPLFILENGFTPGGMLLADWLLCDWDAPFKQAPNEKISSQDGDFSPI